MKLEIFKHKKDFKKGGFHTNPDICWEIIVYVGLTIILGVLVLSFLLFKKINQEFTAPDSMPTGGTSLVTKVRVDKALQYFSDRTQKTSQILTSPSPIVDPSL